MTFGAGGVYPFVWVPAACTVALLALSVRPRLAGAPFARATDILLALTVLSMLVQMVPLPAEVLHGIVPRALVLRA